MTKMIFDISEAHKEEMRIVAAEHGLSMAAYLRTLILKDLKAKRQAQYEYSN